MTTATADLAEPSPAQLLAESGQLDDFLASLSDAELQALPYDWHFWARPKQLEPTGNWFIWLLIPGRGFGKTRAGAEVVQSRVERGLWKNIALINDTEADVRKYMIEGESGLVPISPPWCKAVYEAHKARVCWPEAPGGPAYAHMFSAEAPQSARGGNHDGAWADEAAKWRNLRKQDQEGGTAWDNILLSLRTGPDPRMVVTTTPRAIQWLRDLKKRSDVHITTGSSFENRANLSPVFYSSVIEPLLGTRLGRQEVFGEDIEDVEGALWSRVRLDANRVQAIPALDRVVVAIDPAGTSKRTSDETGLVVCGCLGKGAKAHGYVLEDLSGRYSPQEWARLAIDAYQRHRADRIVAEVNFGGEMVEAVLRSQSANVAYKALHASRGKAVRAEPVAALDEQGRAHMVGAHARLEDELCQWVPGDPESPGRLDAMVWAMTELIIDAPGPAAAAIHVPRPR